MFSCKTTSVVHKFNLLKSYNICKADFTDLAKNHRVRDGSSAGALEVWVSIGMRLVFQPHHTSIRSAEVLQSSRNFGVFVSLSKRSHDGFVN